MPRPRIPLPAVLPSRDEVLARLRQLRPFDAEKILTTAEENTATSRTRRLKKAEWLLLLQCIGCNPDLVEQQKTKPTIMEECVLLWANKLTWERQDRMQRVAALRSRIHHALGVQQFIAKQLIETRGNIEAMQHELDEALRDLDRHGETE